MNRLPGKLDVGIGQVDAAARQPEIDNLIVGHDDTEAAFALEKPDHMTRILFLCRPAQDLAGGGSLYTGHFPFLCMGIRTQIQGRGSSRLQDIRGYFKRNHTFTSSNL